MSKRPAKRAQKKPAPGWPPAWAHTCPRAYDMDYLRHSGQIDYHFPDLARRAEPADTSPHYHYAGDPYWAGK